jgi:hypothetical protein
MKKYFIYLTLISGLIACSKVADPTPTPTPTPPAPTVNNPGIAALSSPAKNKTCEEGVSLTANTAEVTFSWAASTDTESYDLVITDLNSNVATTQSGLTATSKKVTLTKAVPYSWKVVSKSTKTTTTTSSESWNFYLAGAGVSNYAPFPATIVAPKTVLVTPTNGKVNLSWTGSDPENDALTYTVYIDKVDGKQDPPATQKNITAKTIDVSVEVGQVYYWRIKTSDAQNSSYTVVYQFKVQ